MNPFRTMISAAALTAAVAGLAACKPAPQSAPPPLSDAAGLPLPPAPDAEALPPAPPARVSRGLAADYAYLDRAYEISDAFYDDPPDYAFEYDGVEPWAWRTDDGYMLDARVYVCFSPSR